MTIQTGAELRTWCERVALCIQKEVQDKHAEGHCEEIELLSRFNVVLSALKGNDQCRQECREHLCLVFESLVSTRIRLWSALDRSHALQLSRCLRLLLQHTNLQNVFFELGGCEHLSAWLSSLVNGECEPGQKVHIRILRELIGTCCTLITHPLWASTQPCSTIVHTLTRVIICSVTDHATMRMALAAITCMLKFAKIRHVLEDIPVVPSLVSILSSRPMPLPALSSHMLVRLCEDQTSPSFVHGVNLIGQLLVVICGLDHARGAYVLSVLQCLCAHEGGRVAVHRAGAIPLLLDCLRNATELLCHNPILSDPRPLVAYVIAISGVFSHLSLYRPCAIDLSTPTSLGALSRVAFGCLPRDLPCLDMMQTSGLRCLRYIYSITKQKAAFARALSPGTLAMFAQIQNYQADPSIYVPLVCAINQMDEASKMKAVETLSTPFAEEGGSVRGYEISELLGRGAFGSVYKVQSSESGKVFALKEIQGNFDFAGTDGRQVCSNDVTIAQFQLKHPHIVRCYEWFSEGQGSNLRSYVVMQYVDGVTLAECVSVRRDLALPLDEHTVWLLFFQIASALRYLHTQRGIVHRDLTPANVMVTDSNHVYLTDFGLARQWRGEISMMKSQVGTIQYSSPEVVQHQQYGSKVDIWALGCLLYLMAALAPPFATTNMLALARKIAEADYDSRPLSGHSAVIRATVRACLTVDPTDRPDIVGVLALASCPLADLFERQTEGFDASDASKSANHNHATMHVPAKMLRPVSVGREETTNMLRAIVAIEQQPPPEDQRGWALVASYKRALFACLAVDVDGELAKFSTAESSPVTISSPTPKSGTAQVFRLIRPGSELNHPAGQCVTYGELKRIINSLRNPVGGACSKSEHKHTIVQ